MKKRSTSQSAFFNLRVLIGLFIGLAGVFLALVSFGVAQTQQKKAPIKLLNIAGLPPGFDCSKIRDLGIDKQENLRAGLIMIACGESQGGSASPGGTFSQVVQGLLPVPLAFGAGDVDLITGPETFPAVTQSETYTLANPDNPNQIVVTYNDSRTAPGNYSGGSYSSDGGATFTRLTPSPFASGHGTNFGDPVTLYNKPTSTFFGIFLATGCGGQGIGSWKSTDGGVTWAVGACVHNGSFDDRESGVADNNPASPFFGRMYVSWNDFAAGQGIYVTYSSDNGATWHSPIQITPTFIRNVQITADKVTGDVYIAGMDEGPNGGLAGPRSNKIYRSTDGGNTWTNTYTGPNFPAPGRADCTANPYFVCMYSPNTWRHMGWGEPAAYNHVVSLVYAQHGAGADPGDVYYIRSTDSGMTFGAPVKLNTDTTTRLQWQPNLSVSDAGTLFSIWYDERESTSCTVGNPGVPCYRMWARKSNDNGATWLANDMFSDVVSPLPAQPDPNVQPNYQGDYDYGSAILTKHLSSWVDGRVTISGTSQQDAFTDRELVGFAVTTTVPACNSVINTQPVDFIVNLSDPALPSSVQASDFTVNGTPANSFVLSNGNATITFHFNSSPVVTQGLQTMHIAAGAILRNSDSMPIFEFTCTFCYAIMPLQVTTTVPPVGGTFTPPAPGDYQYDVNFNQAVDPASVQTSDLTLTGNAGGSVTAVSVINGNMTARFTLHFNFGGSVTASIGAGAITAFGCNGNVAFSGNYTVEGCPPGNYVITPGTDTIVPGTTDTGNHIDDGDTLVNLPFPVALYDQTYNAVNVNSNGRLDFVCVNEPLGYVTACIPPPANQCPYDFTIFGLWEDMRTDFGLSGCAGFPGGNCGIFTSVTGSAPDRIFNIEWRTVLFANNASRQNFEVRLYENPALNQRFDVIYGTLNATGADHPWVAGVQGDGNAGFFTQDFCIDPPGSPPQNVSRTYEIPACTPTPTPTPTPGQIRLRFGAHERAGTKVVRLHWIGATSATVDIYRNGVLLATANNDGSYTDVLTVRGIYTYKVCEAGTMNCSNEVEVRFRGP